MTNYTKLFAALALVVIGSSAAMAQTDFGSPIGAGSGVGGSIAPRLPMSGGDGSGAAGNPLGTGLAQRVAEVGAILRGSLTTGTIVVSPAGGTVVLTQSIAQALGGVLGGSGTSAQISTLGGAGVPAALISAIQTFASSGTRGSYVAAIDAYNVAVDALPRGAIVPPALLAIRAALAGAGNRGTSKTS